MVESLLDDKAITEDNWRLLSEKCWGDRRRKGKEKLDYRNYTCELQAGGVLDMEGRVRSCAMLVRNARENGQQGKAFDNEDRQLWAPQTPGVGIANACVNFAGAITALVVEDMNTLLVACSIVRYRIRTRR